MTPTSTPLPSSPKKNESTRLLALTLSVLFLLQGILSFFHFWSMKRPINILGIKKSANTWKVNLDFAKADLNEINKLEVLKKKDQTTLNKEALANAFSQSIKANEAQNLNLVPLEKELSTIRHTKLDRFFSQKEENTYLARAQQKNKNLNIKARFDDTIRQIGQGRLLENLVVDTEFFLPWETDFETGRIYFQSSKLNVPENILDLSSVSEEDILQFYTRNIDSNYRSPNFCQLRHLVLDFEDFHSQNIPSETELREYFQKNSERFIRPLKRCFRYSRIQKTDFSKTHSTKRFEKITKKDFNLLSPKTDVCSKNDLPSDFAQTLFQMSPGEICENVFYNGDFFAIEYLFEIPEKKLDFFQARPLVLMQKYEETKEHLKQELMKSLVFSLPLEGPEIKNKIDELFATYHFKPKWKTISKRCPFFHAAALLRNAGMDQKSIQNLMDCSFEEGKTQSKETRYGRIQQSEYGLPIIVELSNFSSGKISPLVEVKDYISRSLSAEKYNEETEKEILNLAGKVIQHDLMPEKDIENFDDNFDFGEERRIELKPLSLQIAEYQRDQKLSIPTHNNKQLDASQKLERILTELSFPKASMATYALLPPEYDPDSSWQLIRYFKKTKLAKIFSEESQSEEPDSEMRIREALLRQKKAYEAETLDYHLLSCSVVPDKEEQGILEKSLEDLEEKTSVF